VPIPDALGLERKRREIQFHTLIAPLLKDRMAQAFKVFARANGDRANGDTSPHFTFSLTVQGMRR
jgi:hypothetical protein